MLLLLAHLFEPLLPNDHGIQYYLLPRLIIFTPDHRNGIQIEIEVGSPLTCAQTEEKEGDGKEGEKFKMGKDMLVEVQLY